MEFGGPAEVDYSTISAAELALNCFRAGDEQAWAEFVRRFHPLIARVVIRVARQYGEVSPQAVDDLVQDTYLKICTERTRLLASFTPAHADSIYGYIKVFTANLAHDHFKAANSKKRGGREPVTPMEENTSSRMSDATASGLGNLNRNLLLQEVDECLKAISSGPSCERDRRIFWLYFRAGLTAKAIATLPTIGLTTKGVESTLLRLTRQVRGRLVENFRKDPQAEVSGKGIRPPESL